MGSETWFAFGCSRSALRAIGKTPDGQVIVQEGLCTGFPRDILPGETVQLPRVLPVPNSAGDAIQGSCGR